MAPFTALSVLTGLKERVESILLQGDTLYLGTSTGSLNTYTIERKDESYTATQLDTRANFTRRAIEQLGYIRDVNSLVSLADGVVTLSPLPTLAPQTPLTQARNALSFAVHVSVQMLDHDGSEIASVSGTAAPSTQTRPVSPTAGVPTVVTQLAIGCRKKLVLYSWKDGEPQDVKELNLPHSPRGLAYCNAQMIVMGYTPTDHAIAYLSTMSVAELVLPSSTSISASGSAGGMGKVGINALSGLGGYMVSLASKTQKPSVIQLSDGEVLVTKESASYFIGPEGKLSRKVGMTWGTAPDDAAFVRPYVLSILPASSSLPLTLASPTRGSTSATYPHPHVHVRSSISLSTVQTLSYPFVEYHPDDTIPSTPLTPTPATPSPAALASTPMALRLLTASPSAKSPAFLVTTPTEKAAAAAQGSTIWLFTMQSWGSQIDELVDAGSYHEALLLLDTIDQTILEDKPRRIAFIRALHAVDLFGKGQYDDAINIFLELDTNPAKVVALYPEPVSGRLVVPREDWITLFGGKKGPGALKKKDSVDSADESSVTGTSATGVGVVSASNASVSEDSRSEHATASIIEVDASATADAAAHAPPPRHPGTEKQAVETLVRYLSDLRPKLSGALSALKPSITPSQAHLHPTLSSNPVDALFALPDGVPIASLVPDQLLRFAQIVDTALFKSYLVIRPSLIGSLCRLPNWCEVGEVEEELRARKKFSDLIDLYRGKKMHEKALTLIHELSLEEDDIRDKLEPAIRYLQKLGPEHLELIFKNARWVIDVNHDMGLQIFTAEDAQLPREKVSEYLLNISPALCAGYMEYLIDEAGEANPVFHDRLAELYLRSSLDTRLSEDRDAAHTKLLHFIRTSEYYSPDRLFGRLPNNSLFEARAILLGRLGRHEAALEIYVHRLQNYEEAEEYCKRIYQTNPDPKGIFLSLLLIYLRSGPDSTPLARSPTFGSPLSPPPPTDSGSLLVPALELISRHSARLDSASVLELLPPLVPASAVQTFLFDALDPTRSRHGSGGAGGKMGRVIREVWKARKQEVDSRYVALRSRKVRVSETRICPQCHKRIGNNVIAVHSPRGEVTHYGCREAFAAQKQLTETARR